MTANRDRENSGGFVAFELVRSDVILDLPPPVLPQHLLAHTTSLKPRSHTAQRVGESEDVFYGRYTAKERHQAIDSLITQSQ